MPELQNMAKMIHGAGSREVCVKHHLEDKRIEVKQQCSSITHLPNAAI